MGTLRKAAHRFLEFENVQGQTPDTSVCATGIRQQQKL